MAFPQRTLKVCVPQSCSPFLFFSLIAFYSFALLAELFAELGPLKSATLATKPDGSSKGFALVTYKRKADAETAIEKYNGVPLGLEQNTV